LCAGQAMPIRVSPETASSGPGTEAEATRADLSTEAQATSTGRPSGRKAKPPLPPLRKVGRRKTAARAASRPADRPRSAGPLKGGSAPGRRRLRPSHPGSVRPLKGRSALSSQLTTGNCQLTCSVRPLKGRSATGRRRLRPSHPGRPQRARPLSRGPPPTGPARLLDFQLSRPRKARERFEPGWSLGILACWMCTRQEPRRHCLGVCRGARGISSPRERDAAAFTGTTATEIRLIRLSVYQALESATPRLFTGTTATETLEEDLGDQHFAARFPGAASEAVPRRVRGARKLALSWAWLRRSPNRPSGERVESRAFEE
jgi:hypothetical protein